MENHTFERGQWLAGRVYPERCDLSPNGQLLVYFGMRRGHTWTAISRPPLFSPLAVWEEPGTRGGGGIWASNSELMLRANPARLRLDPKYSLPADLRLSQWSGASIDTARDGWTTQSDLADGTLSKARSQSGIELVRRPQIERDPPSTEHRVPYAYQIVDRRNNWVQELGPGDWADWGPGGELLCARGGRILAATVSRGRESEFECLAEFTDDVFERIAPQPDELVWPELT